MLIIIKFKLYYRISAQVRQAMTIKQEQSVPQVIKQIQASSSPNSSNFFNIFFQINRFFQEKNKLTAFIILSFKYQLPFILLLKDLPVSQQTTIAPQMKKLFSEYSIAFHTLIAFNKFLIIGYIISLYHETFHSTFITKEINRIFKTKLRGLIEIDFNISMLFLSFDMVVSLPNFLFSICIYIFASVFLENYINKQDIFYCASYRANTYYRLLLMFGYIIAAFNFAYISNSGGFIVAISLYIIVIIIWFYLQGCIMYPNELVNKGMIGFISLLISVYILIIQKYFVGGSQYFLFYLIKIFFTFIVNLLACYLVIQKRKERKCYKQNYHIFQIKNVLNDLFINQTSTEKIAFIYAQIQFHQQRCHNINCEIHSLNLYSQTIVTNGETWGICKIFKSYFRCLYEEHLNSQSSDSRLLEYIEYLYSEKNPNQYKMSIILAKINADLLNIYGRSSLWSIRRNTEKIFKNQMDQLYNGKLYFEQTLAFDESYKQIQKQISYLIKSNMKVYRHLEQTQIDLNVVFDTIRDNLDIQKSLSKQWLAVSNSLKHQKDLTIAYYYYKQLIKNQRLSRQDLQLMNIQQLNNSQGQSIFLTQENCFNPAIILHKETMVFTCKLLNQSLLFKDINHNFQYYMGYNREELLLSSIDHIFNDDLRQIHQASFKSWMQGTLKSSFQTAGYQLKKTQCLTKDKVVLPVLKYFKSYLNSNSQLQFVCMLKVNKKVNTQTNYKNIKDSQEIEVQQNKLVLNFDQDKKFTQFTNDYAIFIKDKQFQPSSKSGDISNINVIIFIFFMLICVSLIAFHLINLIYAAKLQSYAKQYITFMQCYRFPMILGNSYLQSILNIGNQVKIASQIDSWSNSFAALASNPIILQTLYDLNINLPRDYFPYRSGIQVFNSSEKLDQLQIFYMISSSISSLRAPINPKSQDFIKFDQLITPSYDNMLNSTKQRFHLSFIDYIKQMISSQIIIGITQISIVVIFILIMINRIRVFVRKMRFISDAIVNYKKEDLQKILHYWIDVNSKFRHIFGSYTRMDVIQSKKSIHSQIQNKNKQIEQQFTNRINKTIIQNKHYKNFNKISILSFIVATIIVAVSISATEINRISKLNDLIYFENEGYLFLRYFPTATIVGYGCNSKYRSEKNPQIVFNASRFDTSISAMKLVGNFTYIPDVKQKQSAYFSKQRNYFFGNPCRYNPNVINNIGVSIASCQSIINGSFSRGLTSYMREGSIRAENYIQGISKMNTTQLSQFSLSVSILSGYILDAINTWGTEFNQNLVQFIEEQTIFTSINFCVLIMVFAIIICWFFIRYLRKEYQFYRYMFMKMIPEYILRTDKVARQTFINFNILE